jgi:antitoxin (DNA-binding transcriptional repressor) of toxin-antitoxin stability system
MAIPYISVPQERLADRLDELIQAARDGARVVITRDGQAHAQICPVNPLLTEDAHNAIEELKNFPKVPYVDEATWWYIVKGVHE